MTKDDQHEERLARIVFSKMTGGNMSKLKYRKFHLNQIIKMVLL